MGTTLTGKTIKSTYKGLIKTTDNDALAGGILTRLTDGFGNESDLEISTTSTRTSTMDVTGALTSDSSTAMRMFSQNTAVSNNELVRLDQMNSAISGLSWQVPVLNQIDFTVSEPVAPTLGDRYINTVTGTSSGTAVAVTANYIYEWDGSDWAFYVPLEGWTVWDEANDTNFSFNGTAWVEFGSTVSHNNTTGLQGGTAGEYFHLTSDQFTNIAYKDEANAFTSLGVNSFAGDVRLGDNNKLLLGTGSDLQMYHDGSNSYISQAGVGKLIIDSISGINVQSGTGETRFTKFGENSNIVIDDSAQVNKVVIKSSGNSYFNGGKVGIGTTTPSSILNLEGVKNTSIITLGSTTNDGSWGVGDKIGGIDFYSADESGAGSGVKSSISYITASAGSGGVAAMTFNTSSSITNNLERMRIDSAGNVGIGTTTPSQKLHVVGTTYSTNGYKLSNGFSIGALGANSAIRFNSGNILVNSSLGSEFFRFDTANQRVGIGTTSPASKLQVDGGIQMSDDADVASASKVGTMKYRADANNSYVDMCMQTGASTYAWINITQNNW